ncbi:hypothetical protein ACU81Q_10260 [Komagataeibacter melomenusus]
MTTEFVQGQTGATGWTGDRPMCRVSLSERFADHLVDCLRGLTLDLASVLMQHGALNLGLAERRSAGGATELVLGEGADVAALDRQLRAAFGAAGFELPERDGGEHEASPSDDWDAARDRRAEETECFRTTVRGLEKGLGTLDACQMEESLPSLRKEMRAAARRNARDLHYKPVVPSRFLTDEEWLSHPAEVSEVFRAIGMGTVDDPVQWLYTLKVAMEYAEAAFAERVARNPATGIEP